MPKEATNTLSSRYILDRWITASLTYQSTAALERKMRILYSCGATTRLRPFAWMIPRSGYHVTYFDCHQFLVVQLGVFVVVCSHELVIVLQ